MSKGIKILIGIAAAFAIGIAVFVVLLASVE